MSVHPVEDFFEDGARDGGWDFERLCGRGHGIARLDHFSEEADVVGSFSVDLKD